MSSTSSRQGIYALLGILGLLFAGYPLVLFAMQPDPGLVRFYTDGMANPASSSMTLDVVFSFLLFAVFVRVEGRRVGMRHLWVYVVLTLTVALAPALALFLLLRERALAAQSLNPVDE